MIPIELNTWRKVHAEVLRRIYIREWKPGELIPNENILAKEFGCARVTVNRALRQLAESGLLERRRKVGTRVALPQEREARFSISNIRKEIEKKGFRYSHGVLLNELNLMPEVIRIGLGLTSSTEGFHITTLYLAGSRPYAYEDRWINIAAAPDFEKVTLDRVSANEWLIKNVGFSHGTLDYHAVPVNEQIAGHLGCAPNTAIMVMDRTTFCLDMPITWVRLSYAPGHSIQLEL